MTDLAPCPFCGQGLVKNGLFSKRNADCFIHPQDLHGVDYGSCPAAGFRLFSNDTDRIAAWNRRASPAELPPDLIAAMEKLGDLQSLVGTDFAEAILIVNRHLRASTENPADAQPKAPEPIGRHITFSPYDAETGNAVVSPDEPEGPYWTLIAQGGEDEQNRIAAEIVRRLNAVPEDHGWRPIETAPRDGTTVVLAEWSWDGCWRFGQSYWRKYQGNFGEGFAWIGHSPTHWMPLPAPPLPSPPLASTPTTPDPSFSETAGAGERKTEGGAG